MNILQERARALGVDLHFEREASADLADWAGYDLVIAADGANSRIRDRYAEHFGVDIQVRRNKFFWFGTHKVFEAFTFAFEQTEAGWVWAHAYRFDDGLSTFIVEMDPETWAGLGLDAMDQPEAIALCERIFAKYLDGHALMSNADPSARPAGLAQFPPDRLRHLVATENLILLGDAAHTAHFSIGSGTKLALEDAIKLAEVLNRPGLARDAALAEYQAERNLEVLKLQNSARNSTEWFETLDRYLHFEPIQFAYSLLTRSQRVSHENLRLRDKAWLEGVERWFQSRAAGTAVNEPAPPMFAPVPAARRWSSPTAIVVSPMAMYSAEDGMPERLPPRPLRRPRPGRRRPRLHRDDLRLARGADHAGLRRHVRARACRGLAADRRFRPRQQRREILPPARPFRAARARPRSAGRAMTCRSTAAIGRSWPPPTCRGAPTTRCRGR